MAKRRPSVEENTQLDELFPEEKRRGKRKRSPHLPGSIPSYNLSSSPRPT